MSISVSQPLPGSQRWTVAVLAAGMGKRMRSLLPKVLHRLAGRPLIDHVLELALLRTDPDNVVVVVGHGADQVRSHLAGRGVRTALQEPQLGTGDALRVALATAHTATDAVLVLSGDVPLLRPQTVAELTAVLHSGVAGVLLTAELDDPGSYGRVVRGADGAVQAVVEAGDAGPEVLPIREVNAGVYAFRRQPLEQALAELAPDNLQGEYYLTDVVAALNRRHLGLGAVVLADSDEMLGINTRRELAAAARVLNRRTLDELMAAGVTVIDPLTTWVDPDCRVDADAVLEPGVVLRHGVTVGQGAQVGAGSVLEGTTVAAGEIVPPLTHRC